MTLKITHVVDTDCYATSPGVKKQVHSGNSRPPRDCSRPHVFWKSPALAKNSSAPAAVWGPRWWVEQMCWPLHGHRPMCWGWARCTSALRGLWLGVVWHFFFLLQSIQTESIGLVPWVLKYLINCFTNKVTSF